MFRQILLAAAGVVMAAAAQTSAVETSLRPKARPASPEPGVRIASATLPAQTVRPMARPEDLALATDGATLQPVSNPAFQRWVDGFKGRARAAGINAALVDRAFRNVRYYEDVVYKDRHQAEFTQKIWDYIDNATSPPRVDNGKKALRKHRRVLDRIEQAYGVDKEVVAAVWGVESRYGTRMGTYPVIDALATLAFDGRRGPFFEKQLIAALKILQRGDVALQNFMGSWAGAMGHTQFIPTSYQAYAVDFTGDGRRDIWSSDPSDALASTAAYLKRFGWRKGQPWGVEVRFTGGNPGGGQRMPSQWAQAGVVGIDGRPVPDYGSATLLRPAGGNGPAFLVFSNFSVIKRYNNSDAYALAVGHLSDRIQGRPPIQAAWPRGYEPLSFNEKMEVQRRLKRKGYPLEKIDGLIGKNTVAAIKAYQRSIGVQPTGYPSKTLLRQLKGG